MQRAALAAVEPGAAVRRHVECSGDELIVAGRSYDLRDVDKVWVVGGGKASCAMAASLSSLLGERIAGGLVVTKYGHTDRGLDTGPVEVIEAGHPVPDEAGVHGARRLVDLVKGASGRDLVLVVLSGGGSALLSLPAPGLSLSDLRETTRLLLRSGASIVEQNMVRKHLSRIKGGELARQIAPARAICLVLSDVVGDPLDAIASGPTYPDPTTYGDACEVLRKYDLTNLVPAEVREHLETGRVGCRPDTPKPQDILFQHVQHVVVGNNRLAAEAAVATARAEGLDALLLSTFVEGEAREVARVAVAMIREMVCYDRPVARPACIVWGGETTVTVRGEGKGGRNQELALAAAIRIADLPDVLLVALGTDGTDGPTDAAGAAATGDTVRRARALGLDPGAYLSNNDSYSFFDVLGDLIRTGPTGTNVNDLLFMYAI
jgi:glycerate 2-kinase